MKGRFHGLDGLRGVCALSVLLLHTSDMFHKGPLAQHGFLAVDMFFILSGFVIALNYETALRQGLPLAAFLRARGRRLLPVYWLGVAFSLPIFLWIMTASHASPAATWLLVSLETVLMLPAFGAPGIGFSPAMINVTWSLFVEWIVNTIYAGWLFRRRTRTLLLIVAAGWAAMAIAGYFTGLGWCVGMTRYDVFGYGLLRGVPGFLMGVVLYRLHARGFLAKLPHFSTGLLLTLWLCIAVVPAFSATPTFDAFAVVLLCPLLVALLIRSENSAPAFCKPLGDLSYPLYVTHPGIIMLAQGSPLFGLQRGPDPLRAILVVAACLAVAAGVQMIAAMPARRRRVALNPAA
jgi:peptidoglycan/LPS O-acetylase OafA/YrhL